MPEVQVQNGSQVSSVVEQTPQPEVPAVQINVKELLKSIQGMVTPQTPIPQIIDYVLAYGYQAKASDVHIDPQEGALIFRYRIDGILQDVFSLPKTLQPAVITRIKVLSGLRTDEHQAAQDGRFKANLGEEIVDFRVSIMPTFYGENAVLRLLTSYTRDLGLAELGLSKADLEKLQKYIRKSYGMILAAGPTGSGKTTSLYSMIQILNTREISIMTLEDPIEYSIGGISQIQVNPLTNLTFAKGLRSLVRQDPNVIMVGEIRDEETAGISVNAALTGHLLLSTVHTNDAATTLPRLSDMGIQAFLIASSINVIIAQRLVRRICQKCKTPYTLTDEEKQSFSVVIPKTLLDKAQQFWKGAGCEACDHRGYLGRIGIYEVLEMDDDIRKLVIKNSDAEDIKAAAVKKGMVTMLEDGFQKTLDGLTSIAEILRVIHE